MERFSQHSQGSRVSDDDSARASPEYPSSEDSEPYVPTKEEMRERRRRNQEEHAQREYHSRSPSPAYYSDEGSHHNGKSPQYQSDEGSILSRGRGYSFEGGEHDYGRGVEEHEIRKNSAVRLSERRERKEEEKRQRKAQKEAERAQRLRELEEENRRELEEVDKQFPEFAEAASVDRRNGDEGVKRRSSEAGGSGGGVRKSARARRPSAKKRASKDEGDGGGVAYDKSSEGAHDEDVLEDLQDEDVLEGSQDDDVPEQDEDDVEGSQIDNVAEGVQDDDNNDDQNEEENAPNSKPTSTSTTKKRNPTKKAKPKRKKSSTSPPLVGAKPARPSIPTLTSKPKKKDLLKGPVSEKVDKKKQLAQIKTCNERIKDLETYIGTERKELEDIHKLLVDTVKVAYDYIDTQDNKLAWQSRELDELREKNRLLEIDNGKLENNLQSANALVSDRDKNIDSLNNQLRAARRATKQLSAEELIELDNVKAHNQMKVNREKEFSKVDAHEAKKEADELRQEQKFTKSKGGYRRKQSGGGAWSELTSDNYSRHGHSHSRGRSYSREPSYSRGRSYDSRRHGRSRSYDSRRHGRSHSYDSLGSYDRFDDRSRKHRSHSSRHGSRSRSTYHEGRSQSTRRSNHHGSGSRSRSVRRGSGDGRIQSANRGGGSGSGGGRSQSVRSGGGGKDGRTQSSSRDVGNGGGRRQSDSGGGGSGGVRTQSVDGKSRSSRRVSGDSSSQSAPSGKSYTQRQRSVSEGHKHPHRAQCDEKVDCSDNQRVREYTENGSASPRKTRETKKSRKSREENEDIESDNDAEKTMGNYQTAEVQYATKTANANAGTDNLLYSNCGHAVEDIAEAMMSLQTVLTGGKKK